MMMMMVSMSVLPSQHQQHQQVVAPQANRDGRRTVCGLGRFYVCPNSALFLPHCHHRRVVVLRKKSVKDDEAK
ncbi:hypothetical protein niasHT_011477 [Heterodera trifolii]|uniref:Secreted protein n=1 Tax=Heterodera trifolii TaxID=157864 RepID=A0ABD2L1Z6_9BILA